MPDIKTKSATKPASPSRRPGSGSLPGRPPRRRRPAVFLLGAGLLLILLAAAMALRGAGGPSGGAAAPVATPTIDPRLVIRPRTVTVAGALSHNVRVSGSLYPAYPGRNTLQLVVRWQGQPLSAAAPLVLAATMPGMAMTPIHARLGARDHRYSGAVTLPMFGSYLARISVVTSRGQATGTIVLPLTLTQPHS